VPHRIEIDDEVYAELERNVKGFEQPNDVLRRLLLKDVEPVAKSGPIRHGPHGRLKPLIDAGFVKPDDKLVHEQKRKGNRFEGTVTASGWISTEKGLYQTPSPALGSLVGTQIDGWAHWTHERTGNSLGQLRWLLENDGDRGQ
jgi:hypothetical protein